MHDARFQRLNQHVKKGSELRGKFFLIYHAWKQKWRKSSKQALWDRTLYSVNWFMRKLVILCGLLQSSQPSFRTAKKLEYNRAVTKKTLKIIIVMPTPVMTGASVGGLIKFGPAPDGFRARGIVERLTLGVNESMTYKRRGCCCCKWFYFTPKTENWEQKRLIRKRKEEKKKRNLFLNSSHYHGFGGLIGKLQKCGNDNFCYTTRLTRPIFSLLSHTPPYIATSI